MSDAGLVDAHSVIVDAIRQDFSTVTSMTFAGHTVATLDDHDPLGVAFYVYALLRTNLLDLENYAYPDTIRMWAEERVSEEQLSAYHDRDLGALGLIAYSFCKYRKCPNIDARFASLAKGYFHDNKGLFDSFLTNVLVALALKTLNVDPDLYEKLATYINTQLRDRPKVIFNDAKNLVIAHLWAKETGSESVLRSLRNECLEWAAQENPLPRDQVYAAYVLLEEIKQLPRSERPKIKKCIEDSLRFIQNTSIDSSFGSDIIEQYSYDAALSPMTMSQYGHAARPRLSRILLSVGLIIKERYTREAHLLFSSKAQVKRLIRGTVYPFVLLLIAAAIVWQGALLGAPFPLKPALETKQFLPVVKAVCLYLPLNFLWTAMIGTLLVLAYFVFERILITGRRTDEITAATDGLLFLKENWKPEAGIGFVLSIILLWFG
jgi:hypothetical protein